MKKFFLLFLVLIFAVLFAACGGAGSGDETSNGDANTIVFHDKTFSRSDLSAETLEWLENYNSLSESEQLSISGIPSDLYELCGYAEAGETAAVAEKR